MPSSTIQRINPATLPTPPGYSQLAVASGGAVIKKIERGSPDKHEVAAHLVDSCTHLRVCQVTAVPRQKVLQPVDRGDRTPQDERPAAAM